MVRRVKQMCVCGFGVWFFCAAKRDYEMYALRTKLLQRTVSDLRAKTSTPCSSQVALGLGQNYRAISELLAGPHIGEHSLPAPRVHAKVLGDARSLSHLKPLFVQWFPWEEEQSLHPDSWMAGTARHLGHTHAKWRWHNHTTYYLSHFSLLFFFFSPQVKKLMIFS